MAGAGGGEHSKFAENQKARRPLLARSLGVIARRGKVGPCVAPIVGALRRPRKCGRAQETLQRPGGVVGNVGDEAQLTAALQDAGDLRDGRILNKAPLPMPTFRPGIGVNEIDARQ